MTFQPVYEQTRMPDVVGNVLLLGDTHGNLAWTCRVFEHAATLPVDGVLQLGDFGYWPRDSMGKRYLIAAEETLAAHDLPLWFIDGNHDDHDRLGSAYRSPAPVKITDLITYLPRGTRWQWGGTTWVALGGASSVDRDWRVPGMSWFDTETMSDAQRAAVIAEGPADIVVAHDAPWGVPFLVDHYQLDTPPEQRGNWPADALRDSDQHMKSLAALADALHPRAWFHGHHHIYYRDHVGTAWGGMDVCGLNCDGQPLREAGIVVDRDGTVIPWAKSGPGLISLGEP